MNRFTWCHGLALALAGFAVLLVVLTRAALSTEFHLVREDYYAAELRHTERMAEEHRGAAHERPELSTTEHGLLLTYSPASAGFSGELHIYSPARPQDDQTVPVTVGADGLATAALNPLPHGRAYVEIRWSTPEGWAVQKVAHSFPVPGGGGR